MSISYSRANLPGAGAPKVTYGAGTFWTRHDLMIPLNQTLKEQVSSMYGRVTHTREGRKIEFELPLYGFWDNLPILFPAYLLDFTYGARIFGTVDTPMTILARNGDEIVIANCQLVGISNLKLAANQQIFSGNFKFVALIGNNQAPTSANAYYTRSTGVAYAEGNFPETDPMFLTWTGAWGALVGFTTIYTEAGWEVAWEIATKDDVVDGVGPIDQFVEKCWLTASCIPVGPTRAQLDAQFDFQGANADVGADAAAGAVADLILSAGTHSLTIHNAMIEKTQDVYAPFKKRQGETLWTPANRTFTTGAPQALAAVA